MGLIEDKIKEMEIEKIMFLEELEIRIARLKKEGHIGPPNHMHFEVIGDATYKYLMAKILNDRGLQIFIEGKKMGNKFIVDCSKHAYDNVVGFTIEALKTIVIEKEQNILSKFWDSVNENFRKVK